jgi:hypothetical protein
MIPYNPYAPPHPAYQPPVVLGSRVTLSKQAPWPSLCVKCGVPHGLLPRTQRFQWFPPWTYALLLAGVLPFAIVQMVMTKRASVVLPVCAACNGRWTLARVLHSLAVILPIVLGLVIAGVGGANDWSVVLVGGFLLMTLGTIVLAVLTYYLLLLPRTLRAVYMDDWVMTIDGVAPAVLTVFAQGR